MNLEIKENEDNIIYSTTQKLFTKVMDVQDKETIRAIEEYCEVNNIIPNIIDKDKLDLVLKLGIQELNKRGE